MKILEIKIDNVDINETIDKINDFLTDNEKHYIVTPNPEFLVEANKNANFKKILNYADLSIVDGIGLALATKIFYRQNIKRTTGADLTKRLLQDKTGQYKIYLLGGQKNSAKKASKKYPDNVVGRRQAGKLDPGYLLVDNLQTIKDINDSKANILLVGFGQVKQEMWIYQNYDKLNNVNVAIGVGGSIDYVSENVKRAPKWMRKAGLEWLYRVIKEPSRIKRIINAVFVFPFLIIKNKYK